MWQSLRDYRAGLPERLARWKQTEQASQETLAQVKQHELSSRDIHGIGVSWCRVGGLSRGKGVIELWGYSLDSLLSVLEVHIHLVYK